MRIVFTEERNGEHFAERTVEGATIKVGRDETNCQVFFEADEWSMVSRQHAEFIVNQDRCFLADLHSTFGTFLDNHRITEPTEVRTGAHIQFGERGPSVKILRIEFAQHAALQNLAEKTPRPSVSSDAAQSKLSGSEAAANAIPVLELLNERLVSLRQIPLTKELVRLGREPGLDVEIDADAAVVSRRHAEIRRQNGNFVLVDLNSFNGTLLNEQRITSQMPLYDGDRIELGPGGPVLRFVDPAHPAPGGVSSIGPRSALVAGDVQTPSALPDITGPLAEIAEVETLLAGAGAGTLPQQIAASVKGAQPQFLIQRTFGDKSELTIGRAEDNDIRLDGLLISNHHARFLIGEQGLSIEDLDSTNGVYVGGTRITDRQILEGYAIVQIGPFLLQGEAKRGVAVFDTRTKTRLDAIDITKEVANRSGSGIIKLLDNVSLTIQPNEFVGLLGPSGAGKSTLMDALNGMRPASSGQVLINGLDLYQHLESLKQSIGYVPQDDIIHRELTVYRTLYYVARLRLARDISEQEIDQIVSEVLDVTGLSERRDVPVAQLSGGQRKRVSIAVELITKPSVIFLDEPTSGLDPATEDKIMKLFRQIAESGRTVILTTHAMENVRLFDKVVVLMRGKLVYYGTPQEALVHVGADSFKELYDRLEAPIVERLAGLGAPQSNPSREQAADMVAEDWKQRFQKTQSYTQNVELPANQIKEIPPPVAPDKRKIIVTDALRQWRTLARRYLEVLAGDKVNLLILFGQAPIVAFLTYLVVGRNATRDFAYFVPALVAIWFGASVSAREIIRERAVYKRERMINLGLLPYVGSKLLVLSLIVSGQCILLLVLLKLFVDLPGSYYGLPQLLVMILTGMVGVSLGLFVSAIVKTSEMATSLVPLILIPQILFSGLVGVPEGRAKVVGMVMPATWSFDEMKRLSHLQVLRGKDEGAEPSATNAGRGLYKQTEYENDQNIADTEKQIEQYQSDAESSSRDFEHKMNKYQEDLVKGRSAKKPTPPKLRQRPSAGEAKRAPVNLSGYVDFLHPLGSVWLDPAVLLLMFLAMILATTRVLHRQDIR